MDQIVYYIAQALGIVAIILGFINYIVKTREQILVVNMATIVCFIVHYALLGAWTGMMMNTAALVRNAVFYFAGKDGPISKRLALSFSTVMCVTGVATSLLTQEGWYFVLSALALAINSYAMSFSNPNNIRKSILITSPMVLAYNCFVHSIGGIVYEAVAILSSVVGIMKYRKTTN